MITCDLKDHARAGADWSNLMAEIADMRDDLADAISATDNRDDRLDMMIACNSLKIAFDAINSLARKSNRERS